MKDTHQPRRMGRAAAIAALAVTLAAVPAAADRSEQSRDCDGRTRSESRRYELLSGECNPTNVKLVSSDLAMAMAYAPEQQVRAPAAWSLSVGSGALVAVLDGGFNVDHPAVCAHIAPGGLDAVDRDSDVNDHGNGLDDDGDGVVDEGLGHGTFVAGMILKVAPEAQILPIRVRDDEGRGFNASLAAGLRYAIDRRVDVINMSLEASKAKDTQLMDLMREATSSGIVVVLSAGNDGRGPVTDLALGVPALVVGAVDENDAIAPFSSYQDMRPLEGQARMIFAPGVNLYGPVGTPTDDANAYWSGTSFAAPFVAGAAALLRQVEPELCVNEVVARLADTAYPVYDAKGRRLRYSGRLDVGQAVGR